MLRTRTYMTYMYLHTCTHLYMHVHVHIIVHVHIYLHVHVHTYLHTYLHVHTFVLSCKSLTCIPVVDNVKYSRTRLKLN